MQGEHFQLLDPESSLAMFDGIGLSQSLGLDSGQLAGMFNAMEAAQFQQVGGDQLVQVVGNITGDDLSGFHSDQALWASPPTWTYRNLAGWERLSSLA